MSERHTSSCSEFARKLSEPIPVMLLLLALGSSFPWAPSATARQQSLPSATGSVRIVLPARVVAGKEATLAVLSADGKLAPGVAVNLGADQSVTTDRTGRALFTVIPNYAGVLLAKARGASAAALADPASAAEPRQAIAPVASLREPVSVCGTGLRGNADSNRVRINGRPALVMAASPECIVVLPGPKAEPGPEQVSIEAVGTQWTADTTLVSLAFEPPKPALLPGKKGSLTVRVRGSDLRLRILVENRTPGVLRFSKGDMQDLLTSGGPQNLTKVKIQAIRSGDFAFDARLLPAPDADAARRYLLAAEPLAPQNLRNEVGKLASKLSGHPGDLRNIRRELGRIRAMAFAGDFRALLDAAWAAL